MFREITSIDDFQQFLSEEAAVLAYFSTDECNVCKVLRPKVENLIDHHFSKIKGIYINSNLVPEVAAQNRIFTAPTILVFFDGKEFLRKSRSFGIDELRSEISRPYLLMFS